MHTTKILNEPFNSPVLARQTLGRTRANNTLYIDVVDTGFRTLMIYYRNKIKISYINAHFHLLPLLIEY